MNLPLPPPPPDYARRMPVQPEATALQDVGPDAAGRPARLHPTTAEAWSRLQAAAARDGITLELVSGFRSIDRQAHLLQLKLARGVALNEALQFTAYPGHSEHHTGHALDLGTPGCTALTEAFASTPAFVWLQQHAGRWGFHLSYPPANRAGIGYEPWHWCHHPGECAQPASDDTDDPAKRDLRAGQPWAMHPEEPTPTHPSICAPAGGVDRASATPSSR